MDWKDVEVGDYVSIKYKGVNQIFSGEITQIRHYNRQTDTMIDPLAYYFSDDYYEFCIKIQRNYGFKEYALNSLFWNLLNIERKNKMETQEQQLKLGDTVLVTSKDVKRSLGFPVGEELVAEIVVYNSEGHILIQSNQLVELRLGHNGERPQQFPKGGCWWVSEKDLQLTEKQPEFDIFM